MGLDRYNGLFLCILLAGLCVLMSACVYAGPLDETAILREEMLRKKQEMALLDYNAIEEMIGRAETLFVSTSDQDRIEAYSLIREAKTLLTESRPVETRAVWLDDQALAKISSPDEMRNLIAWLNDLNVNLILPCVYFAGETIYPSEVVEQATWYRLSFPNDDPLQIIIDEARKYGMEVHPWIMVYGLQGNIEPFLDRVYMIDKNAKGQFNDTSHVDYFLSPAHPETVEYLVSLILELAKYDIDGVHLDNIRYKDGFGYGDFAVDLYQRLFGLDPREFTSSSARYNHFREFKAQFVASFVERVRRELFAIDPHLFVSAATAPRTWGKNSLGQDWHNWIDNRSLHFVLPMSYTPDPKEYRELLDFDLKRIGGRTYAFTGMTLYSFTPEVMVEEWKVGQEMPTTGQTLFSLLHIKQSYYEILKKGLFRDPANPTFRDPQMADCLFLDWLVERFETLGTAAGLKPEEVQSWIGDLSRVKDLIAAFSGPKYGDRDLRTHSSEDNAYWNGVLGEIDALVKKTESLSGVTQQRIKNDLLQLRSLISPLEYTTRPFELVKITY